MNASTALRAALAWLHKRLKPPKHHTDWVEYSKQIAWRSTPRLLPPPQPQPPSTYEPPGKTTDPTQQVHHLAETGRIASMIRTKPLPSVKGLSKTHFYKMPSPEEVQADRFLLDVEPAEPEPESALDQLAQLTETDVNLKAVREKHESRGKAS